MHDFDKKRKQGEDGEKVLEKYYSSVFDVQRVGRDLQRAGIDRIQIYRRTGKRYTFEYKTEIKAQFTGNIFIETVSVDVNNKPGWAYSSKAQFLAVYVVGSLMVYQTTFQDLRRVLPEWIKTYPEKEAINDGYKTKGIIVPLNEFAKICTRVETIL